MSDVNDQLTRGVDPAVSEAEAPGERPPALSETVDSGHRHQSWCSAEVPPGAAHCPRCGCWQPANRGAWKTGLTSAQVRRALFDGPSAVALAEQRQEIETDLGGPGELTRIQRDLVGRYVETASMATWLAGNLVADGVLTARGRARQALNAYLGLLDRQHKLAVALGLERRARHVDPVSAIREMVARRSAEAERERAER